MSEGQVVVCFPDLSAGIEGLSQQNYTLFCWGFYISVLRYKYALGWKVQSAFEILPQISAVIFTC